MVRLLKIFRKLLCCLTFAGALVSTNAQNPFDLLPRVPGGGSPDSLAAITASENPFDIVKVHAYKRSTSAAPRGFEVVKPKKALTVKEKETIYRRFLFITVLTMMVILTLAFTVFRILFEKIWKAFLNDNLLNQLMREQGAGITLAYLILYAIFFLNSGIFLFLVCRHYQIPLPEWNFGALMLCIGALAGFFLFKHLLLQIVGFVFPVKKEISAYNFTIIIFNIVLGFVIVPAIFFTAYAPAAIREYVIFGTAGVIALTYLFRGLRGLFIANRFLAWHKFHFLLYLCAVEIAPLLIVVKLLFNQQGI